MVKNVIASIGLGMLLVGTMNAQNLSKWLSSIQDLGFLRPQTLPLDRSLGTINTTHWTDLNEDGRLDLLIGSAAGLFVRWGGASPSGLGEDVPVSICEGREVLKIHDSGCGSGLVWVECAETHRSMLLDFQPDGSCEAKYEIDGVTDRLFGAGGSMFWLGPDERGVIQAFEWDVNLSQAVPVSSIQAAPVMLSMLVDDFDGDGLVDFAATNPDRGLGIWWNGGVEMDWVPNTKGIRGWAFVHAGGDLPQITANDFESASMMNWTKVSADLWEQRLSLEDDPDALMWVGMDDEFMSTLDEMGRRFVLRHSLVTQSLDCSIRDKKNWIGNNTIGASERLHSFQVLDVSGDGQSDLLFFEASTNAVWVVQQHLPGALGPMNVDMGCGFGPQEWFVPGEAASSLWTRPFWEALPKSFRMYLEEAVSNPSDGIQELIHHSGRAFLVQDSSFLELQASENMKTAGASKLSPWPTDPGVPRLSSQGLLGVHVPSARMKFETAERSGFTHAAEVPLHEWSHWVYTRDKNLRVKTYINGELVLSAPGADVPYDHRNLILGAAYGRGWHDYYRGSVDEVEVIHRILTEEEVRSRYENRKAEANEWTICLVSFDGDLDPDGPPRNDISNAVFRSYGDWEYVDGVHGRGIRFDGETGAMRVAADIPEVDVTYSFWFRPEEPVNFGAGQVLVSGYGMFNTNMTLLNTPLSVSRAEPLEFFEVKEVEAPEPGRLFLHNAKRFWLGKSFQLHLFEEGVWKTIECGGRAPDDEMDGRLLWESDGAIHWLDAENGQIHSLDLNTFTWQVELRLPLSIGACQLVANSQSGRAFANFETGEAWWWPKASNEIYPIEFPTDALAPGDGWSGFSLAMGSIALSSRTGVQFPLIVDASKQPVAIRKWGHLGEFAHLLGWGAVGFMLLVAFRLAKAMRAQKAKPIRRHRQNSYSDELLEIVEKLKQHDKVALDSMGLDELLGLTELDSEETRRSHRAKWVKDINAWSMMERSKAAILREKDPFDRRRMLYRLDLRD